MAEPDTATRILALWSLPRSRSTAFFRMMLERGDFRLLHEPFSNLAEFGRSEVDGRWICSHADLLTAIRSLAVRKPVFFKDTTDERYPALLADEAFLGGDACHTFMIRHPRETIASYHALNPSVRLHQIGAEALHEIYTAVRRLSGREPVVVDAGDLVTNPAAVVRAYCSRVGVPFLPHALTWQPGERAEWRPTARWHADVSTSSGFVATGRGHAVNVERHPVLREYLRYHLPFYKDLYRVRLTT